MQKIYFRGVKITSLSMFFMAQIAASFAGDLPEGGQITAGSGNISQSGNNMTITQNTDKMVTDWQSFSIGQGNSVNFIQPSASSVALNRVLGSDVSTIQGAINANGQVFIINPNGVLFTATSQINTGGLVASTLNITNENFLSRKYQFEGTSSNAVINEGNINITNGGTAAFIAAKIINHGEINADEGNVLMAAGEKVTLDLGGAVKIAVEKGALETLIEQGGAIRADGGTIYLTAKAADELSTSVINHTGISRAQTLASGKKGEIILLGDMSVGKTQVAGTLDASAPIAGNGGFIETSAANVETMAGTKITASSAYGKGGQWLIDPFDYVINSTAAENIVSALNSGTDVTVTTTSSNASFGGGSSGNGDITVNSAIAKTAGGDATLTLRAANTIVINAKISSTSNKLNMLFDADNDNGTRNGGGVTIVKEDLFTNGGSLDFGTGDEITLNSTLTKVGGDLYIGDANKLITFDTNGGDMNVNGEFIIANPDGVKINTRGGDVHVTGIINSGNSYEKIAMSTISGTKNWTTAQAAAESGAGGAVGDTYLATVTSRLENAVVGYTANYASSWLGGERVMGIGTNNVWRWTQGPEGLEDSGNGLQFFTQDLSGSSGTAIGSSFTNWNGSEPNNSGAGSNFSSASGENALQIVNAQGQWNDLSYTSTSPTFYIKETNYATADLTVDAGSGTTTFDAGIGGLKPINFTAYNSTNPNPNPDPNPNPTVEVAQTVADQPKTDAVTTAQSSASNPQLSQPGGNNGGVGGIGLHLGNNSANPGFSAGSQNSTSSVGSLEIVNVTSKNNGSSQNKNSINYKDLEGQVALNGIKVFVIDGGINFPNNLTSDNLPK